MVPQVESGVRRPSESDAPRLVQNVQVLYDLFDALNVQHFGGQLEATLAWSTRMRVIAGNCDWQRRIIRISWQYHVDRPHELRGTMLHEMLHLHLRRGHDAEFRREARRLGAPLWAEGPARRRPYKYVYRCPHCLLEVLRRRKGSWSCGRCSGGRYNPAYRLQIIRYLGNEAPVKGPTNRVC